MDSLPEKYFEGSSNVLVDFYAEWCEPCKWVVPVLDDLQKHFGDKIAIHKINIDVNIEVARSLSVLSVPTLVLFVNKKEVWRMRGFDRSPQLIQVLGPFLVSGHETAK